MNNTNMIPTHETLLDAQKRISPYIHKTPVLSSSYINGLTDSTVFFKCENFQKVGAFKARGGFNAVLSLSQAEREKGITAHSSGNHAQAVALAAQTLEIPATIVMPSTAPKVKKRAVEGYGAKIISCEPTLAAREDAVNKVIEETGATLIHPFNDYRIIAGQATSAMELIDEITDLDFILTPVGGGGLLCGTGLAAKYFSPATRVIGTEPEEVDDAYRSFKSGILQTEHRHKPNTVADGLLTTLGDKNFEIIKQEVSDILIVSEKEIMAAMRLIWERMKIIIEPSCAVPVAALIRNFDLFKKKKVGIILSGGNVDLDKVFGS